MEFDLISLDEVRSICKDYQKYEGTYVGEDLDGNMAITEVYPDHVYVMAFLDRGTRITCFYIDGRIEETYTH